MPLREKKKTTKYCCLHILNYKYIQQFQESISSVGQVFGKYPLIQEKELQRHKVKEDNTAYYVHVGFQIQATKKSKQK